MDVRGMLRKALGQLEREKARIDRQIASLQGALSGAGERGPAGKGRRGRRRSGMSAAARKATSRRMKAYWAKRRAQAATKKR